tara:strand:+ start:161 stop:691 length:531 start_codon:yes stop_codon:yes gene_type:complete
MIIYDNKKFEKFISNKEITNRVLDLSKELNKYYKYEDVVIICVLNGSVMVLNELVKKIDFKYSIDYIEASSYKGRTKTSGTIDVIQDITTNITDKNIVIIEDIVDTGTTLNFIYNKFLKMNPKDIKIFSLLYKEDKYKFDIKIDWYGFKIQDKFTIGYGMDYNFKFRGLNDIYALS